MATLIIDYSVLSVISGSADSLSRKAGRYADVLSEKVLNQFDDITGGSNSAISNAKYYVNAKIRSLREKEQDFSNLATQIRDFSEKAKRVDEAVERAIARNQEKFLDRHEHLRIDEWKANLLNWLVDLKNKCPVLELIGNAVRAIDTALKSLADTIRHWYHCEGGRELGSLILAIGGAVLAIAIFVISFPVSGFVSICAAIGATIGLINAAANVATSILALYVKRNGDPAWGRIYGNMDKLSDFLRQTNFDNATLNRITNIVALGLDATELFCDIVGLVSALKDLPEIIGNFRKARWRMVSEYDFMGRKIGTKPQMITNGKGRVLTEFNWDSFKRGFRYFYKYNTDWTREIWKIAHDGIKALNNAHDLDYKGGKNDFLSGVSRTLPIASQINDIRKLVDDIQEMISRFKKYKKMTAH